jgi:hypothetical protein
MSIKNPQAGVGSGDVRSLMLDVGADYGVVIIAEVSPSSAPKLGQLYVRVCAKRLNEDGEYATVGWRGNYFPSNEAKTLTGLLYGLVWGLERDLDIKREVKLRAPEQPGLPW